jgi:hypothetical protein
MVLVFRYCTKSTGGVTMSKLGFCIENIENELSDGFNLTRV